MEQKSPDKNNAEIKRILGSMPKHTVSDKFNDKLFRELGIEQKKDTKFRIIPFLTSKVFVSSAAASILIIFSALYYFVSVNDVSPNYNDLLKQIDAGDQVLTYIEIPANRSQTPVEDDHQTRTVKADGGMQIQAAPSGHPADAVKSNDMQVNTTTEKSGVGAQDNTQSGVQYSAPMQKNQRLLRIVTDSVYSKQDSVRTRVK